MSDFLNPKELDIAAAAAIQPSGDISGAILQNTMMVELSDNNNNRFLMHTEIDPLRDTSIKPIYSNQQKTFLSPQERG
jgi:hypothetical protein